MHGGPVPPVREIIMGNTKHVLAAGFLLLLTAGVSGQEIAASWQFSGEQINGRSVYDLAGDYTGTIFGDVVLYEDSHTSALQLDGETNSVSILMGADGQGLPAGAISLEAWVALYSPERWGGIIGAFQDNGSSEQGWVLGYDNSQFYFALSTAGADDGNGLLTYLNSNCTYELRKWYHVVGTYDGTTQKIYVNGVLEGASSVQSGAILYPGQFWLELGAYHDDNEYFRMHGLLKEALIAEGAATADLVQSRFQAYADLATYSIPTEEPEPTPLPFLAAGPYLQFTDSNTANRLMAYE